MIEETGRLLWIWLRITLALLVGCGIVVGVYGWNSTPVKIAVVAAVVLELAVIRGLAREWSWQASGTWWWSR
ncbi:MAG: hypothetical protein ACRDTC_23225 [Pseudonocardiaceae bacterium]